MRSLSYYFFARPSFLEGAARALDLGGVFDSYKDSATPSQVDTQVTLQDWMMVGTDLQAAISAYEQEQKKG